MKFKNFIIVGALLSFFISCNKNSMTEEKYFDPEQISSLLLEGMDGFWDNDSLKSSSNYFNNSLGYLGGVELMDNGKRMGVAVFESQELALSSMERRIISVAGVIIPGETNEILKGKWWHSGDYSYVFASQWNTIIEVGCLGFEYEVVKTLLLETAAEISDKIDSMSQ